MLTKIKEKVPDALVVNADSLAAKLGNPRVVNVIFLGVLSKYLDIPAESYTTVLKESLKPKLVDINMKAFDAGRALVVQDHRSLCQVFKTEGEISSEKFPPFLVVAKNSWMARYRRSFEEIGRG